MVERSVHIREVRGSSPLLPTTVKTFKKEAVVNTVPKVYTRCLLHTQEVTGSSPVSSTMPLVLPQKESPVLEILDLLFEPELRRRLMVRQMSNGKLFLKYQPELRLRIHNEINLKNDIALLDKLREFLGDSRPSPSLAKEFLSGYY